MNPDAILNMLQMQHRMNSRVHADWIDQRFEWYRAAWIECGELMDHVGYKWWKKQTPDMEQVRLEVVDIWHFGMSALFRGDTDLEVLAQQIAADFLSLPGDVATSPGSDRKSAAICCANTSRSVSPLNNADIPKCQISTTSSRTCSISGVCFFHHL